MAGCLVMGMGMLLPGFLLGLFFGKWGLYISIGLFALYTLLGLLIFPTQPRSAQDEMNRFRLSKAWTYSIFWVIGSIAGMYIHNGM